MKRLSQTPQFKEQKAKVDAAKTWAGKLKAAGAFDLVDAHNLNLSRSDPLWEKDNRQGILTMMVLDDMIPESEDRKSAFIFAIMSGLRGQRPRPLDMLAPEVGNPNLPDAIAYVRTIDPDAAKGIEARSKGQAAVVEGAQASDAVVRVGKQIESAGREITDPLRKTWAMLPWLVALGVGLYFWSLGGRKK